METLAQCPHNILGSGRFANFTRLVTLLHRLQEGGDIETLIGMGMYMVAVSQYWSDESLLYLWLAPDHHVVALFVAGLPASHERQEFLGATLYPNCDVF